MNNRSIQTFMTELKVLFPEIILCVIEELEYQTAEIFKMSILNSAPQMETNILTSNGNKYSISNKLPTDQILVILHLDISKLESYALNK